MQHFQYQYLLHLLWLIIPLIVVIVWAYKWRTKVINQFFDSSIQASILPFLNTKVQKIKSILLVSAAILLIIGMANPQIGSKREKIKGQGIDIMLLLDVSNSMLAQDIQPNRLERSKLFISKLLDNLKNDRVGLIIFAGNSYLQIPLTIDFSSIKMSLPIIDPTSVPSQGTNIGEAVNQAGQSLGLSQTKHKAIVILTDGEDHDENANAAIEAAKKNGIKVFAIGVGEEKGAPIPLGNGEFKKDENGKEVSTAFNRKMLEELASVGNGSFYHLGAQSDIVEDVVQGLEQIEGKDFEDFDYANYSSYYYWFALIALLLIFIEFILPNISLSEFKKRISNKSVTIVFVLLFFSSNAQKKETEKELKIKTQTYIRKGNANYQSKKFQDAENFYRKSLVTRPNDRAARYNLGNALYEQQKYQESIEQFQKATLKSTDKTSMAKGFHNMGNAYFKSRNLDKAIENYENALKLNPSDMDTKFNLALAKKAQDQSKNQQKQQQNQQQQQQPQQDKGEQEKEQEGKGDEQEDQNGQGNQPAPQQGKNMSKNQAESLLNALKNQEQNTQQKVQMQKGKPEQKKHEKDW